MKQWIRRSFQSRIFVTVLLITLLPIFICNVVMLRLQVRESRIDQENKAQQRLEDLEDTFSQLCHEFTRISDQLSQSTAVRSVLRKNVDDSRVLYQVLFRDTQQLRQYAQFELCTAEGVCYYTTDEVQTVRTLDPAWGILYAASQSEDLVFRSGTQGDTALEAAEAVRSHDGSILGYIVISMTQQHFDRLFGDNFDWNVNVILLDRFWDSVYCSQSAVTESITQTLRMQLMEGKELTDHSGSSYYVARSSDTGFFLILQQSQAFTRQALSTFYSISATLGMLCLLLCLLYTFWLSRHLAKPVNQMDQAMEAVRKGDYSVRLDLHREDEFGRLADSFNSMTEEYCLNLERSILRQKELNATQIRMMQAQLNPHFLYNTLDSIKWLGITHGSSQISAMAMDLAAILRASISEESFVTLEQELELIERYLEIQYIRFEDRFTCEVDVPDQLQYCLIPKLSLEPLVENAIIHGVADQDDGYIKISARQEAADLILTVTDNGCGIPADILEKLNSDDKRIPGHHLGLYNVDQIARLHFGEGYGIRVISEAGKGSQVILRLPLQKNVGERKENTL